MRSASLKCTARTPRSRRSAITVVAASIHISTMAKGRALRSVSPASTIIWYDFAYDGNAATSCCPAIVFFCSNEHLQQWLQVQAPQRNGIRLTVGEALEVGRAIFGPVLADRPQEGA